MIAPDINKLPAVMLPVVTVKLVPVIPAPVTAPDTDTLEPVITPPTTDALVTAPDTDTLEPVITPPTTDAAVTAPVTLTVEPV